jgi:predicted nucleic acid-binding protein
VIFIDTGALFALLVPDDRRHQEIENWRDSSDDRLITTDYCVDELLTLLVARKRSELAITAGWKIFNDDLCRLHFLTPEQIRRAWVIFQAKHTFGWSFTDCTSKVVIDEFGSRTAASLDQHFRQFGNLEIVP